MGGFTLRGVAADAQRFTGSLFDLHLDVPDILPEHNSPWQIGVRSKGGLLPGPLP